jgi:hypothetical protein
MFRGVCSSCSSQYRRKMGATRGTNTLSLSALLLNSPTTATTLLARSGSQEPIATKSGFRWALTETESPGRMVNLGLGLQRGRES